ncbi:DUF397 domain-containing protein [Streptomyces sp. NPDC051018]|uniref:DUF397 domain-containing protein n=1 Tax=Streptomyces sp. NPDC051018 TaxID=3365639 RepID=UPI0037961B16
MSQHEFTAIDWVSSSYSGSSGGQCVEWAPAYTASHTLVPIRDSKMTGGPTVVVGTEAWDSFVEAVKGAAL